MNLTTLLQFIIKLALFLLTLLPLHEVFAQKAGKEESKMHIKLHRTVDGKTVVVDTTFTAASHEELVKAIKAARLDTAYLMSGKVRAFTFSTEGNAALNTRLKGMAIDTVMLRKMGDVRMRVLVPDSLKGKAAKHIEFIRIDGDAVSIKGQPRLQFWSDKDSSRALIFREGQHMKATNPSEIERIVVERVPGRFKMDSLLLKEGRSYIRIMADEKAGNHKIYRVEEDGKEVEVKGEDIGLGIATPGKRAIFIVRKAKVEDISAAEKEQLKATGAPVEMKSKEELKVESINYYPNPNNGRFNLSFTLKNKGTTVVRIMNEKGNEVFVDTVEKLSGEYSRQIDISPFGPGLYFLQVAQNGRYYTKKLLVQ
ncbi:MAG: T9SS type A sorting domain-containing protein [Hymenobacteraceae bacterium]|nr:T9SS type A sorting domain-containing protein [Hymenobacteraceae bacterium]